MHRQSLAEHREGFTERKQISANLVAEWRFADDHTGHERAKCQRYAEDFRGGDRCADGGDQRDEHKQLT